MAAMETSADTTGSDHAGRIAANWSSNQCFRMTKIWSKSGIA